MTRQVFNTSLAPDCNLENVMGDLTVKGWDLPQIAIDADSDRLDVQDETDIFRVNCRGDCEIRLPRRAELAIDTAHGDVRIKLLDETVKIGQVQGSLNLRSLGGAQVGQVQGDISARNLIGDLELGQVQGDVEAHQVQGAFHLSDGGGDLDLQGVHGDIHAALKGDAHLRLDLLDGEDYQIKAQGDVSCLIPPESNLSLRLDSSAKSIKIRLPERVENLTEGQMDFDLGAGGVPMSISAGGEISLIGLSAGWEGSAPFMADFGAEIARQVEAQIGQQMEEVSRRLKDHMDRLTLNLDRAGISPEDAQRIVEQAMRASEREASRAQEKMQRAQEKLERKLEEAQRKAEQKARSSERSAWARSRHSWGRGAPAPAAPPVPPAPPPVEPVSDEERLMILRMLEQKKISPEEADQLLSALEGKD